MAAERIKHLRATSLTSFHNCLVELRVNGSERDQERWSDLAKSLDGAVAGSTFWGCGRQY